MNSIVIDGRLASNGVEVFKRTTVNGDEVEIAKFTICNRVIDGGIRLNYYECFVETNRAEKFLKYAEKGIEIEVHGMLVQKGKRYYIICYRVAITELQVLFNQRKKDYETYMIDIVTDLNTGHLDITDPPTLEKRGEE